jgi:hypothetical protein
MANTMVGKRRRHHPACTEFEYTWIEGQSRSRPQWKRTRKLDQMAISEVIRRLAKEVARSHGWPWLAEAARAAGALPVYADMGGAVLIAPDQSVLFYDWETSSVRQMPAEDWRLLAFAKAARRFPELRSLFPPRPSNAVDCSQCQGTGLILERLDCGSCFGVGWVAPK